MGCPTAFADSPIGLADHHHIQGDGVAAVPFPSAVDMLRRLHMICRFPCLLPCPHNKPMPLGKELSHTFLLNFLKGYSSSSTFKRPDTASLRTLVQCSSFRSGRPGGLNVIHFQSTYRKSKKVGWRV